MYYIYTVMIVNYTIYIVGIDLLTGSKFSYNDIKALKWSPIKILFLQFESNKYKNHFMK